MQRILFSLALFLLCISAIHAQMPSIVMCGTVTDLSGNPIANHAVYIMADTSQNLNNPNYFNTQYTDANGNYCDTVPHFPNNNYYFVGIYDCNQNYSQQSVDFVNTFGANFQICNNTQIQTSIMCGVVTDLSGNPLAGHTVYITGNTSINPGNNYSHTQVTDAWGNYCDTAIYNPQNQYAYIVTVIDCNQNSHTSNIDFLAGITNANFQICATSPGNFSICGTLSSSLNFTLDSSTWVYLIDYDPTTQILSVVDSTIAIPDTSFRATYCFNNAAPGSYRVKAALSPFNVNYPNLMPTYHTSSLLWSNATVVQVGPSTFTADIQFIGGNNPGGPGFVGGSVLNGANKTNSTTVAGAAVKLTQVGGQGVAWTLTNANGQYSFPNIAYGTYKVWVDVLNLYASPITVTVSAANPSVQNQDVTLTNNPAQNNTFIDQTQGIQVYPNPAQSITNLTFIATQSEEVSLKVLSLTGSELWVSTTAITEGQNTLSIPVSTLSPGMYWVEILNEGGEKIVQPIQVQR